MKKASRYIVGGLFAAMATTLSLQASESRSLSEWKIGEVQVGEEVTMADLEGQVVVVEYWGTR